MGICSSTENKVESTYTIEGIPVTITCIEGETGCLGDNRNIIRAYNKRYGLNYEAHTRDIEIWNNFVNSMINNTYIAKFSAGNLHIKTPEYPGPYEIHGLDNRGYRDPSRNAAILTCYRINQLATIINTAVVVTTERAMGVSV